MITVKCELKDENLYSLLDDEFEKTAGMKKIGEGQYEGDGSLILHTSFLAIDRLLERKGFIESVKLFKRVVGEEEEDIFDYYDFLKRRGSL